MAALVCLLVLPFDKELFRRGDGAVAQPLGIAARKDELYRAEEALIENLFLVGDELAHAVGHFHGAAFQFDHADGDAVQVEDQVRPALIAAAQVTSSAKAKSFFSGMLPIDEMHCVVRLPGGDLHLHAVAQKLIRAQIGLIEGDAGRVGGGQLLQGGGIWAWSSRAISGLSRSSSLDAAVVLAFVPVAEIAVAEAIGSRLVGEQVDDAILCPAFGAWLFRHAASWGKRDGSCR